MQLTLQADYAMRLLLALATEPGRQRSVADLAAELRVSQNHLAKVAQLLIRQGYLVSARGRSGGVRLAREPQAIKVGDVVRGARARAGRLLHLRPVAHLPAHRRAWRSTRCVLHRAWALLSRRVGAASRSTARCAGRRSSALTEPSEPGAVPC